MWPMVLDMSKDECRRMLRRLELEAYSSIVTAFRAQGDLSKEKKKMLQELCSSLSISTERHRAEIRRAVNDEKLNTIADRMVGSNTSAEWAIEGRRLIPLLPRLVPQTAFTAVANHVANMTAAQNAQMPPPGVSPRKQSEASASMASPLFNFVPPANPSCSTSPNVNVPSTRHTLSPPPESLTCTGNTMGVESSVVEVDSTVTPSTVTFPTGKAIHVKDHPLLARTESPEDEGNQKRRLATIGISNLTKIGVQPRSSAESLEPLPFPKVSSIVTNSSPSPRTVNIPISATPMKITLTSSSVKSTNTLTNSPAQKVILVSGSTLNTSLLQRTLNVPIVKTVTATGTTISVTQPKTSLIMPGSTSQANSSQQLATVPSISSFGNVITVATSTSSINTTLVPTTTVSVGGPVSTACMTGSTLAANKARARQKGKSNLIVPATTQSSSHPNQSIQVKPITMMKPSVQIKNESGVKIITQTLPLTGNTKILPKPSIATSPSMIGGTSPSSITVMTKALPSTITTAAQSGTRVVNVIASSQAARLANGSSATKAGGSSPTIITVTPQNLQATAAKLAAVTATGRLMGISSLADTVNSPATSSALLMVRPKNLQTATIKVIPSTRSAAGTSALIRSSTPSAKPNVIVVQKAQVMSQSSLGSTYTFTTSGQGSSSQNLVETVNALGPGTPFEKEIINFLQRQDKVKTVTIQPVLTNSSNVPVLQPSSTTSPVTDVSSSSSSSRMEGFTNLIASRKSSTEANSSPVCITKSAAGSKVVMVGIPAQDKESCKKNTVLADILQATGILPEAASQIPGLVPLSSSTSDVPIATNEEEVVEETTITQEEVDDAKHSNDAQPVYRLNEWIQMDADSAAALTQETVEIPATEEENSSEQTTHSKNDLSPNKPSTGILDIQTTAAKVLNPSSKITPSDTIAILQQAGIDLGSQVQSSNKARSQNTKSSVGKKLLTAKVDNNVPSAEVVDIISTKVQSQKSDTRKRESQTDLSTITDSNEMVGELDPQTGIFYPLTKVKDNRLLAKESKPQLSSISLSSKADSNDVNPVTQPQSSLDIFSTAIASAQLDLNPFQFTEEDLINIQESVISQNDSNNVETVVTTTASTVVQEEETVISDNIPMHDDGKFSNNSEVSTDFAKSDQSMSSSSLLLNHSKSIPNVTRVTVVKMPSFVKIDNETLNGTSSTNTTYIENVQTQVSKVENFCTSNHNKHLNSTQSSGSERMQNLVTKIEAFKPDENVGSNVTNVIIEPSRFDASSMTMEDFTSQRVQGEEFVHEIIDEAMLDVATSIHIEGETLLGEEAGSESPMKSNGSNSISRADQSNSSSGADLLEQSGSDPSVRTSKRKRKAPSLPDESPPHLTGWGRLAMGILQKVSTYRGKNRAKGAMNAADWFLRPVSPTMAPGYNKIVRKPMDFSTIKRKLEAGTYNDLIEFNDDMLLVKNNCELYNPPTHPARVDCNDVFSFYQQEYNRVTDKWQKARVYVASPKKQKPS